MWEHEDGARQRGPPEGKTGSTGETPKVGPGRFIAPDNVAPRGHLGPCVRSPNLMTPDPVITWPARNRAGEFAWRPDLSSVVDRNGGSPRENEIDAPCNGVS